MNAVIGHFKTILTHKAWVFHYAIKCGIPWRGFWHDMSKFSPIEFLESVKFYQGGKSSPIPKAKEVQGYSEAWQHHKGHNPHHYEYWVDKLDQGGVPIVMPFKYAVEMLCDYLAAGRTYHGAGFTFDDEYNWWLMKRGNIAMHQKTQNFVTEVLHELSLGHDVLNYNVLKYFYSKNC